MKQDIKKLGPTLTLAQLYESQNQFMDALALYRRLHRERGMDEAAERIAELEERILSEKGLAYDKMLAAVFTREELKRFKALPHDKYEAWCKAIEEPEEQPADADEEIILGESEPIMEALATAEEPDVFLAPEPEPKKKPVRPREAAAPATADITVGQFITALRIVAADNTPLGSLRLADLLDALKRSEP